MNVKDINHLEWLYNRMIKVHKENSCYDYMIEFGEIVERLRMEDVCTHPFEFIEIDKKLKHHFCGKCKKFIYKQNGEHEN